MGAEVLKVRDVTVARGGIPLLAALSFDVAAGEALTLRGPNGVGKTSLLRTIAGLQTPLRGDVTCEPPAYAGHADALKHTLTARENLTFWAAVYGGGSVDGALAAFDLGALADRAAGTLSAGQKRRLGLARLLVAGRRLWLLDEPTVSLDAGSVDVFGRVVADHLAAGGAAVIATHVDLGIRARTLDVAAFVAGEDAEGAFDEAFL